MRTDARILGVIAILAFSACAAATLPVAVPIAKTDKQARKSTSKKPACPAGNCAAPIDEEWEPTDEEWDLKGRRVEPRDNGKGEFDFGI